MQIRVNAESAAFYRWGPLFYGVVYRFYTRQFSAKEDVHILEHLH